MWDCESIASKLQNPSRQRYSGEDGQPWAYLGCRTSNPTHHIGYLPRMKSNFSRQRRGVCGVGALVEKVALPREMPRQNHYACVELGTTCLGISLGSVTFSTSVGCGCSKVNIPKTTQDPIQHSIIDPQFHLEIDPIPPHFKYTH
jgi:hypothetical protein